VQDLLSGTLGRPVDIAHLAVLNEVNVGFNVLLLELRPQQTLRIEFTHDWRLQQSEQAECAFCNATTRDCSECATGSVGHCASGDV